MWRFCWWQRCLPPVCGHPGEYHGGGCQGACQGDPGGQGDDGDWGHWQWYDHQRGQNGG